MKSVKNFFGFLFYSDSSACPALFSRVVPFSLWRELSYALVAYAILFTASQIAFFLPFTPVPITFGPQGPLLVGAILTPGRAFFWTAQYVFSGFIGAPVFSGMCCGLGHSAGFIAAYPLAAALSSFFCNKVLQKSSCSYAAKTLLLYCSAIIATLPIYLLGYAFLKYSLALSAGAAFQIAVLPFVYGCLFLKIPLFTQITLALLGRGSK